MGTSIESFAGAAASALGAEHVDTGGNALAVAGHNLLPGGDVAPGAVVRPGSTEEVQALVRLANEHGVSLWPTSTGENRGIGLKSPVAAGQVVVDLGARMNRILEIDETLGWAEIEPGVTFAAMYEELGRRGHKLMISSTSGPPNGGILGNAMDKGAGYTPYFDHFGMTCGLEVVLGDGTLLRTGDGGFPEAETWHISKYGYGPVLDGLFAQSNLGIVTRAGMWLMNRPPAVRSFFFSFPDDGDLAEIFELVRPLKANNQVPTLIKVTSDLYAIGTEDVCPADDRPLSDAGRKALQEKHGIGAWLVCGAFYGPSVEATQPMIDRMRAHFEASGKATYIDHEDAAENPMLKIHVDTFSGQPTDHELNLLKWRGGPEGGSGAYWFLPGTPMIGDIANRHQELSRRILTEHGLDYMVEFVCTGRASRALHIVIFNREDPDEAARARASYIALTEAYAAEGYPVGRAPTEFQGLHMAKLDTFPDVLTRIRKALDPNGVIAPGKYGIG